MFLYKFYKQNCHPCQVMKKLFSKFDLPEGIKLIEIDVDDPDNEALVEYYEIDVVPILLFPDTGNKLVGVKSINVMKEWMNENNKAL